MASVSSSSQRYEQSEVTTNHSYSRSTKSATSVSSNQRAIKSDGHVQNSSDFDEITFIENFLAGDRTNNQLDYNNNNNGNITVKALKSPSPRRRTLESPTKDGFRKVTVHSGSNQVNHFSKSMSISSSDDDEVFHESGYAVKYVDEEQIVATDESNYEVSGDRSFEEVFNDSQKISHNDNVMQVQKGQQINFQFNMSNPENHDSDQYYRQNKNKSVKSGTPEIIVDEYDTPPVKVKFDKGSPVLSHQHGHHHDQNGNDGEEGPRYQPVHVEIAHAKTQQNVYERSDSARNQPDYQQTKRGQYIESRSKSDYTDSSLAPQKLVPVMVSPKQTRKHLHSQSLPIDITISREKDTLQKSNDFRVLVSPTPPQNVFGFVPVHKDEDHNQHYHHHQHQQHNHAVHQNQHAVHQHQHAVHQHQPAVHVYVEGGRNQPKPKHVNPVDVYESFQGIEKECYTRSQEQGNARQAILAPVQAEPVYMQGKESTNEMEIQNDASIISSQQSRSKSSVRVDVISNMMTKTQEQNKIKHQTRGHQQQITKENVQARRRHEELERMERARLQKLQQEETERKRGEEAIQQKKQRAERRRQQEEVERIRQQEALQMRKREAEEKRIVEEEIHKRKIIEQQQMEQQRQKEALRRERYEMERRRKSEEMFQQQQYERSKVQRSHSEKYQQHAQSTQKIQNTQQSFSTFPRPRHQLGTQSENSTPNFSQQRKYENYYQTSISASNTPDISARRGKTPRSVTSDKEANCTICADVQIGSEVDVRSNRRLSNPNVILGRTEVSQKTTTVNQIIRPWSVDITRQNKTLPRSFGRTQSQEWMNENTPTQKRRIQSSASSTQQNVHQQQSNVANRTFVNRPKSTTAIDDARLADAQKKYLNKLERQQSKQQQQQVFRTIKETHIVQEQQQQQKSLRTAQQQLQEGYLVQHDNDQHMRVISGSYLNQKAVTQENKSDTSNRNKMVKSSTAYTKLTRNDSAQREAVQEKVQRKVIAPEKAEPKDTYESIRVVAKGGTITLSLEEGDKPQYNEAIQNRLTSTVYGAKSSMKSSHLNRNQTGNVSFQSEDHQNVKYVGKSIRHHSQSSYQSHQEVTQQNVNQHQHYYANISHDNASHVGSSSVSSTKQGRINIPSEYVHYTVCTRYFKPEENDWIQNIHRMGKVEVPAEGSHHQKCIFWLQLYDPDKEEITVRKLVPSPEVAEKYDKTKRAYNSNNEGINSNMWNPSRSMNTEQSCQKIQPYNEENSSVSNLFDKAFDNSFESLPAQHPFKGTRIPSSRQNRSRYDSIGSDTQSLSSRSEASIKHTEPRNVRKLQNSSYTQERPYEMPVQQFVY